MPITGLLLTCESGRLQSVREAVASRPLSEVRETRGAALVVVTDTATIDEDRAEVEALSTLDGVLAAHVVFTNIED